jgi:hypothetical protein
MTGYELWLGSGAIGVLLGALGRPWWYGPLAVIGLVIILNVINALDPLYIGSSPLSGPELLIIGVMFHSFPIVVGWIVGSFLLLFFKYLVRPPQA